MKEIGKIKKITWKKYMGWQGQTRADLQDEVLAQEGDANRLGRHGPLVADRYVHTTRVTEYIFVLSVKTACR